MVAGNVVNVNLLDTLSAEIASQISVRISAHMDFLQPTSSNVINKHKWMCMPIVTETFELVPETNKICSQYGCHLIFMFSEGKNFTINAEVKNVAASSYFRLGETTIDQWQEELKKVSLHCLLETDKVVAVVATSDVKNISDPDSLMNRYDEIITMLNYAAGFDDTEPPPRGKYWLVKDIQITAGSAHAAFPAMFDRTYYDMASEETSYNWVIWHELGHDYQQIPYWEKCILSRGYSQFVLSIYSRATV